MTSQCKTPLQVRIPSLVKLIDHAMSDEQKKDLEVSEALARQLLDEEMKQEEAQAEAAVQEA